MTDERKEGIAEIRAVLAEMRERHVARNFKSPTLIAWADRIDGALAALPGGGVEELRAALQPFADLAQLFDEGMRGGNMPGQSDDDQIMEWPRVNANYLLTVGHLRNARALITPTPSPHEADRNG